MRTILLCTILLRTVPHPTNPLIGQLPNRHSKGAVHILSLSLASAGLANTGGLNILCTATTGWGCGALESGDGECVREHGHARFDPAVHSPNVERGTSP